MSEELELLYKKLAKKQQDLIHCRYKRIGDKLEFEIQTIEIEIKKQKRLEDEKNGIIQLEPPF